MLVEIFSLLLPFPLFYFSFSVNKDIFSPCYRGNTHQERALVAKSDSVVWNRFHPALDPSRYVLQLPRIAPTYNFILEKLQTQT